jgi:hypothetical protein
MKVLEKDWQQTVIEAAQTLGFKVAHFRPAKTTKGWRTPVQADGAGFPDIVMVRGERIIFAELKSDTGKISADQEAWLEALGQAVEAYVWRPRDWDAVVAALSASGPRSTRAPARSGQRQAPGSQQRS